MTTKQEIGVWFDDGVKDDADYMLVVWDSFSNEDYPVFVGQPNNIHDAIAYYKRSPMQRIMECYDLKMDKDVQLKTARVFNYPKPKSDDSHTRSTSSEGGDSGSQDA